MDGIHRQGSSSLTPLTPAPAEGGSTPLPGDPQVTPPQPPRVPTTATPPAPLPPAQLSVGTPPKVSRADLEKWIASAPSDQNESRHNVYRAILDSGKPSASVMAALCRRVGDDHLVCREFVAHVLDARANQRIDKAHCHHLLMSMLRAMGPVARHDVDVYVAAATRGFVAREGTREYHTRLREATMDSLSTLGEAVGLQGNNLNLKSPRFGSKAWDRQNDEKRLLGNLHPDKMRDDRAINARHAIAHTAWQGTALRDEALKRFATGLDLGSHRKSAHSESEISQAVGASAGVGESPAPSRSQAPATALAPPQPPQLKQEVPQVQKDTKHSEKPDEEPPRDDGHKALQPQAPKSHSPYKPVNPGPVPPSTPKVESPAQTPPPQTPTPPAEHRPRARSTHVDADDGASHDDLDPADLNDASDDESDPLPDLPNSPPESRATTPLPAKSVRHDSKAPESQAPVVASGPASRRNSLSLDELEPDLQPLSDLDVWAQDFSDIPGTDQSHKLRELLRLKLTDIELAIAIRGLAGVTDALTLFEQWHMIAATAFNAKDSATPHALRIQAALVNALVLPDLRTDFALAYANGAIQAEAVHKRSDITAQTLGEFARALAVSRCDDIAAKVRHFLADRDDLLVAFGSAFDTARAPRPDPAGVGATEPPPPPPRDPARVRFVRADPVPEPQHDAVHTPRPRELNSKHAAADVAQPIEAMSADELIDVPFATLVDAPSSEALTRGLTVLLNSRPEFGNNKRTLADTFIGFVNQPRSMQTFGANQQTNLINWATGFAGEDPARNKDHKSNG